ncbi:MAG: MBL fold metallo-hydrolase [Draconibacterium sp.]|nr:MAG: MBL fold metallo-hydrolase [Draconibacterium sp.]
MRRINNNKSVKVIPVSAGYFHCDGGALFSVIPKKLWSKVYPADKDNFTRLALRCLYVETGKHKIIIESGIGNHFSDKHYKNNGYTPGNYLLNSLAALNICTNDITDVVFTHLHWDHCTGAVVNEGGSYRLLFPNANHWCSKTQWNHSFTSNAREKVAFHKKVLDFLNNSGKLHLVEKEGELFPAINIRFFNGHTPGQIIPFIKVENFTVVYTSDLIPTAANIPLLWLASYDLYPVEALEEKEKFLDEASANSYVLLFEHDYFTECATVKKDEKGFRAAQLFNWSALFAR